MRAFIFESSGELQVQRLQSDAAESDFHGPCPRSYNDQPKGSCGVYRFRSERCTEMDVIMSGGRVKVGQQLRSWTCTRTEGHEGHHVAHDDSGEVMARWERESPAVEKREMERVKAAFRAVFQPSADLN